MLLHQKPQVVRMPRPHQVQAGAVFHFIVNDLFNHASGLNFSLGEDTPSWVDIDVKTGLLRGKAPNVYTSQTYKIIIYATNHLGLAQVEFPLTVVRSSMRANQLDGFTMQRLFHEQQELLDFEKLLAAILASYEDSPFRKEFYNLLSDKAALLGIKVKGDINVNDFKQILEKANPGLRAHLQREMDRKTIANIAQSSVEDLGRKIAQGSQETGIAPIAAWNYLGAALYQKHSSFKTVLESSGPGAVVSESAVVKKQRVRAPTYTMN